MLLFAVVVDGLCLDLMIGYVLIVDVRLVCVFVLPFLVTIGV